MIEKKLVVDSRGMVRQISVLRSHPYTMVVEDEPYKPNGKHVFVNPETNFLEEGEIPMSHMEEVVNGMTGGKWYRKTSDFQSNGNLVLLHPERREFAEVQEGYRWGTWDKVRDLRS